ncbi:unnamed protein product [Caenorhabditis auriculariae]|uniref:Tyrosine-protein kinase n=1 Tax=Caenorhabditis auriculariae TaxID=2777116 RepID=A0A8S1HHJ3_9PELO|nr:unnamed protein product [Caenorhabditis auriculariae]
MTIKKIMKIRDSETFGKANIKHEDFFHGFMPERQAVVYLNNIGDFLVRQAVKSNLDTYIITVCTESEKQPGKKALRHIPIVHSRRNRIYYTYKFGFSKASGLIDYHRRRKEPVDELGSVLLTPVSRAPWQFNHEHITRVKKLGDGAFGYVSLGTMQKGLFRKHKVAVKTIQGSVTMDENAKLYEEAMIMRCLDHVNVVNFYGIASNEEPIMIVLELAPGGSVEDAVKNGITNGKPVTLENRVYWCLGAGRGLKYLKSVKLLHRDVAARNVLIGRKNEAKISDFGLSLVGMEKKEHKLKKVPFRYLAPETLQAGVFNEKTDVWSFGVYIWEVFHNAQEPYSEIPDNLVKKYVLKDKRRLKNHVGDDYPPEMWTVTRKCFKTDPKLRPSIELIVNEIENYWDELNEGILTFKIGNFFSSTSEKRVISNCVLSDREKPPMPVK